MKGYRACMNATRNEALEAWMVEHGHSSNSLAEAVNRALEQLTGRPGGLDGSSIRCSSEATYEGAALHVGVLLRCGGVGRSPAPWHEP